MILMALCYEFKYNILDIAVLSMDLLHTAAYNLTFFFFLMIFATDCKFGFLVGHRSCCPHGLPVGCHVLAYRFAVDFLTWM